MTLPPWLDDLQLQGKRSTLPFITPDEMHDVLHGKYNLLGNFAMRASMHGLQLNRPSSCNIVQ